GGGTTLGRIGYGYIYPNFNAQVTYSTKPGKGQFSIGVFQPSVLTGAYGFTKIPRLEGEFIYNQRQGRNNYSFWIGGLWQSKTNVGASWGFSRLVNDQTGDGNTTVRSNLYSYTVGVYHQWTKSLKFVVEGSNEGTTGVIGIAGSPGVKMINLSAGFMLFF